MRLLDGTLPNVGAIADKAHEVAAWFWVNVWTDEEIEAAMQAFEKESFKPRNVALAGAFITLARDGSMHVERGFVHPEDEPKSKAKAEEKGKRQDAEGLAPLSEKLVAELTAYRTSALRNELAQHLKTAFLYYDVAMTESVRRARA